MAQLEQLIPNRLAAARSEVLDAFAELEGELADLIVLLADKVPNPAGLLGQKLDALATLKPSSSLSKHRHKQITDCVRAAQLLCEIRNDLVHSRMQMMVGELETAVYLNVKKRDEPYPQARILSLANHQQLAAQARDITVRFRECRADSKSAINKSTKTPPSPPQPLPAAAAGP